MLQLESEVRAKLVHSVVKSLDYFSETALGSLWLDEAERRDEKLVSGSVAVFPGDEVFNRIRCRHGS